ncbi:MAG TPA: hypothetical protein VFB95_07100 [Candidatus Cryosericum sp.]|nr:hypothetical protein [Candidatus Cryosericum sp.]
MRRAKDVASAVAGGILAMVLAGGPAGAVGRDVIKDLRGNYEGRSFRLRIDLRPASQAIEPNVLSIEGIGYGREESPVLFGRFEQVFLERITSEGGARVALTVYRNEEEMKRLRASAIPPPIMGMPGATQTLANFAMTGSTTVMLELEAGKKDPDGQRREIESLLARLFYVDTEPTREELEEFVIAHRLQPIGRLAAVTGLPQDAVRRILEAAPPAN